ncbi:MAG: hypothetical protein AB1568_03555 [Thermodesulfobacteriota bacterium]
MCRRRKTAGSWEKTAVLPAGRVSHGYCPECFARMMQKAGLPAAVEAEGCEIRFAAGGGSR